MEIAYYHSQARIQALLQARFKQFFCHCYLFLKSCVLIEIMILLITVDSRAITRTLANSNQNRFPLDFRHTFTVILPSQGRIKDFF